MTTTPSTTRRPTPRRTATVVGSLALALASAALLGACGRDGTAVAGAGTTTPAGPAAPAVTVPGDTIEVTAVDYRFDGLPTTLQAGPYDLRFTNAGGQEHELVMFRNTSGLTLDELAARGPQGASLVDLTGMTYASAGDEADHDMPVELAPGQYTVVCFMPDPTDGRPHLARGMQATITVA
jgi:plastocyanin